jgi:hypothetical protein
MTRVESMVKVLPIPHNRRLPATITAILGWTRDPPASTMVPTSGFQCYSVTQNFVGYSGSSL